MHAGTGGQPAADRQPVANAIEPLEGRLLLHAGHLHELAQPPVAAAQAEAFHLRINAGGRELADAGGHAWERDHFVRGGGRTGKRIYDVANTADDRLFAQVRQGRLIRYAIPVPAGTYNLNLLFAEPKFTAAGKRTFSVFAEDRPLAENFDVAAAAGGRRAAIARTFAVDVADGTLNLTFRGVVRGAIVSGVEIYQGGGVGGANSPWQPAAPAPLTLFEAQGHAVADRLYVFGGFHNGRVQATTATNVYDPVANTWTPRAAMPAAVTHAGVVADGATVWMVGGLLGDYLEGANTPTRDVWRYDTAADAWSLGPSLPAAGAAGGVAVIGRNLHYFGGFAPHGESDSSQHYVLNLDAAATDPAGAAWTPAASMPTARNHFGTAVVNGLVYAIGGQHGRDETNANLRDVDVYDPAADRWSAAAGLPAPASHFHNSTLVVNNKILVAGGVTNGRTPLSEVWEYDPTTNAWAPSTPLPAPRKAPVALFAAGRVYVLTGSPGDNFPQNDVWWGGI